MDIFNEQIIKKTKTLPEIALVMLLYGLALGSGVAILFAVLMFAPNFILMVLVIVCVIFWGAIKLTARLNIEYEYSVTNNLFDADKIIAKSSRKRIVSLDLKQIDGFGEYNPAKFENQSFDFTAHVAGDEKAQGLYYIEARLSQKGRTLVIFQPDEKIIGAIKKTIPYSLRGKE